MTRTYPDYVQDAAIQMEPNARHVFEQRYIRKDKNGQPTETVAQAIYRVCSHLTVDDEKRRLYYDLLSNFLFLPNTPTWTGAGTPLGQLAACFVLPIDDSMEGIFTTLKHAAMIQQSGGGVGFSFTNLRSRGSLVTRSMGQATGPVGFMRVYDTAFGEIAQGGTRRGANMAVLRIDHPDIEEFINCKRIEGEITNFNISVAVTDKFMQHIYDKEESFVWDLIDPHTGCKVRSVDGANLWRKILHAAYRNGEPGILFIDRANEDNPFPDTYTLETTNPCGEQWLGPYENCCLGSINLAKCVDENGNVDWNGLANTTIWATHFLNDVIDANNYIPSVPQLREAALYARRIGLGIMGLADMFYKMRIRYGEPESLILAQQVMEFIRFWSMRTSCDIAQDRGAFPGFNDSIYSDDRWFDKYGFQVSADDMYDMPELVWDNLRNDISLYGLYNGAFLTVAPTGTLATVAGLEGYGCEPVFSLAYTRKLKNPNGQVEELKYLSKAFERSCFQWKRIGWARNTEVLVSMPDSIREKVALKGSCQHLLEIPSDIRNTFVVSSDITPSEHIDMQAAIQVWVDNSIAKTCNFPSTASVHDVEDAYLQAWTTNCKGVTVYVTGSRDDVVLATEETNRERSAMECRILPGGQKECD